MKFLPPVRLLLMNTITVNKQPMALTIKIFKWKMKIDRETFHTPMSWPGHKSFTIITFQ